MKVVLLQPMKGRGDVGSVVAVKDGFARNYLLPRGLALRATASNLQAFEHRRKALEAQVRRELAAAREIEAKLERYRVVIAVEASPDGHLYGSVRPRDIARALHGEGIEIPPGQIHPRGHIRALGFHYVDVDIYGQITVTITLVVARSLSDGYAMAYSPLSAEERREHALMSLEHLAASAALESDTTTRLIEAVSLADDEAGERVHAAMKSRSSMAFDDAVRDALEALDVNCLVGVTGELDAEDSTLIRMRVDLHGALPTTVGNSGTFRLMESGVLSDAEVSLSLFAMNAAPLAPAERDCERAADGGFGRVTLRQTLKRFDDQAQSAPTEVWAIAHVNGTCVHRRVWSFA